MSTNHDLNDIDGVTLETVSEKIVRNYCVLPKSLDGNTLTLFSPDEADFELKNRPVLEFALDRQLRFAPTPRIDLESAIARHYPFSEPTIQNCNIKFSFNCPKTWASLATTGTDSQRSCNECGKIVHLCSTEQEADELGRKDKCVAYVDPEHGMMLGEVDTE